MNELKKRLEKLTMLEKIANQAENEMMEDPANEEKENAFDEAYKEEFAAFMAVSELIIEMTGGRIDAKTARTMVQTKRNEILSLVA